MRSEKNMRMAKPNRNCIWRCGRETKNISRICDLCWADREAIYQARKAREATQELDPKRQAAAKKAVEARRKKQAEFNPELRTSELLH